MRNAAHIQRHGFDAIEVRPQGEALSTILMLHGYGANMSDLAPLSSMWDPQGKHHWIFLNAPLDMGYFGGRAWYELSVERLMARAGQGDINAIRDDIDPGIEQAATRVVDYINASKFDPQRLVLGGFSQGAITSTQTWLMSGLPLKSLLLFSGIYTNAKAWDALAATMLKGQTKALVSHGRYDEVLPFGLGEALANFLKDAGVDTTFVGFDGGHEIPPRVIDAAKAFL